MLLHVIPGPTSYNYLKTVDGVLHNTFQKTCQSLGLLEDDNHWDQTLLDATISEAPKRLRYLFAVMLDICGITDPISLWEKHKESLSEDILHQHRTRSNTSDLQYNDAIFNEVLIILQDHLNTLSCRKLSDFGLPQPISLPPSNINEYNVEDMIQYIEENEVKLTPEQRLVYTKIMNGVNSKLGKLFFLDAPGGTGKTFLINLILNKIRSSGHIVFAVASCGIAATLLQGGKTAHSTFKLPLNLHHQDQSVCNLKRGSDMAKQLQKCALIVWDECTMSNKAAVEAVDRTLRDLTGKASYMGGITVLFSGDFRQTLPVIAKGTRADEVRACLQSSYLWPHIQKMHLTVNMRVRMHNNPDAERFSNLLLDIGDGKILYEESNEISLPASLGTFVESLDDLLNNVYPLLQDLQEKSSDWFRQRAILATKNDVFDYINNLILQRCTGETVTYTSIDTTLNKGDAVNYLTEFLNSVNLPGLPPHKLHLKLHAPIMLLRNLAASRLCNGTRLRITRLQPNVIEAEILTGCAEGEIVFIPRIPMIPQDCPYEFKRLQFPVKLCFAMMVNKSQGQTLAIVGIDLRFPCFSHGQLYVGCSRVGSSEGLYLLAPSRKTRNVVYPKVLRNR